MSSKDQGKQGETTVRRGISSVWEELLVSTRLTEHLLTAVHTIILEMLLEHLLNVNHTEKSRLL